MQKRLGRICPLFEAILEYVPVRDEDPEAAAAADLLARLLQLCGKIGVGRIHAAACGRCRTSCSFTARAPSPKVRVNQVLSFEASSACW